MKNILENLFESLDINENNGLMHPEFPEFITREGQPLTPHIIPSASS